MGHLSCNSSRLGSAEQLCFRWEVHWVGLLRVVHVVFFWVLCWSSSCPGHVLLGCWNMETKWSHTGTWRSSACVTCTVGQSKSRGTAQHQQDGELEIHTMHGEQCDITWQRAFLSHIAGQWIKTNNHTNSVTYVKYVCVYILKTTPDLNWGVWLVGNSFVLSELSVCRSTLSMEYRFKDLPTPTRYKNANIQSPLHS